MRVKSVCYALLVALLGVGSAFAGEIPKGYRGVYAVPEMGLKLELKEDKITSEMGGSSQKLSVVRDPSAKIYEKLAQGKAGVFIAEPAKTESLLQAYGVIFRDAAARPAGGLTWRRATVFYLTLNKEQPDSVPSLEMVWADDGLVTLDTVTAGWQIGWGAAAKHLTARRIG